MPFLHALTDYRQIAQENVEKLRTCGNYSKCKIFKIQDGGRAILDLPNVNNLRMD